MGVLGWAGLACGVLQRQCCCPDCHLRARAVALSWLPRWQSSQAPQGGHCKQGVHACHLALSASSIPLHQQGCLFSTRDHVGLFCLQSLTFDLSAFRRQASTRVCQSSSATAWVPDQVQLCHTLQTFHSEMPCCFDAPYCQMNGCQYYTDLVSTWCFTIVSCI